MRNVFTYFSFTITLDSLPPRALGLLLHVPHVRGNDGSPPLHPVSKNKQQKTNSNKK